MINATATCLSHVFEYALTESTVLYRALWIPFFFYYTSFVNKRFY